MKDGKCPRCGSREIYSGEELLLKAGPFNSNAIPISMTSAAALDNYVCIDCGLVERYIADDRKLSEIRKKWRPVNPADANDRHETERG
jgi:DNA-directed RNA polymerase subunit RPC12/RpoP